MNTVLLDEDCVVAIRGKESNQLGRILVIGAKEINQLGCILVKR